MQKDNVLNIFKDCDFRGELSRGNFKEKIIKNFPKGLNFKYFHGMSKVCIIPTGADYVIKIPFNGVWYDYDKSFDYFWCANDDENHKWDYCFTEMICYNYAKKEKVEKAFCKTKLLGYTNDYPIYIQQRASVFSDLKEEEDYRSERTEDYCCSHGFRCFNPVWIADAIEYYGQSQFSRLMDFIDNYGIDDLHTENIGYIKNKPVLIDYSDFCD